MIRDGRVHINSVIKDIPKYFLKNPVILSNWYIYSHHLDWA
jgi:hypothetical protein